MADMFEGLSEGERDRLKASIDDLILDTPATGRAVLTLKQLLPKLGKDAYDSARTVLVSVATAAAKQQLGL